MWHVPYDAEFSVKRFNDDSLSFFKSHLHEKSIEWFEKKMASLTAMVNKKIKNIVPIIGDKPNDSEKSYVSSQR